MCSSRHGEAVDRVGPDNRRPQHDLALHPFVPRKQRSCSRLTQRVLGVLVVSSGVYFSLSKGQRSGFFVGISFRTGQGPPSNVMVIQS